MKTQSWQDVYNPCEEVVMQHIKNDLRAAGYIVLCTTHRVKKTKCPKCKHEQWGSGAYGADKGIPDLLVRHSSWQNGGWLGLEVKGKATKLSTEQRVLEKQGAIVIVRSVVEALAALQDFEGELENS